MDTALLQNIKELGIAMLSVSAFAGILYIVVKYAFDSIKETQAQHRTDQIWWQKFVEENNHQKSDMIREHTKAMMEVGHGIGLHTEAIEKLLGKLEK